MNRILKKYFAPYRVLDDYGTVFDCWTLSEAKSWLPFCSRFAEIINNYSGDVVIRRVVTSIS